jgi:predicted transcriptional regulator
MNHRERLAWEDSLATLAKANARLPALGEAGETGGAVVAVR